MSRQSMSRAAAALFVLLAGAGAAGAPPADDGLAACRARYAAIGLPKMKTDGSETGPIERCRAGYALSFNTDNRVPNWVIERLPLDWLKGDASRKNNFHEDKEIDAILAGASALPGDYTGQHYDRGHQAPAGDFKSSQPMTDESFLMTNMGPQVGIGFNRNIWKQLETDVRGWVLCGGMSELYVITGPVYGDGEKWIGKDPTHKVRVPDAFFKVIYDPKHKRALGMLLPNRKLNTADLPNYAAAISDIEEQTGITFFPKLSKRDQNLLKKSVQSLWGTDDSCAGDTGE